MEGTSGTENKKRGLGGLGCTEYRGMEHQARKRRGKEHSFEHLLCIIYSMYH